MHLLLGTSAGTYAEFMCVDEEQLARMPDNMSFQDAAALPLVTLTAWQVPHWDMLGHVLHQPALSQLLPAQNLWCFSHLCCSAHPSFLQNTDTPHSHISTMHGDWQEH